MTDVHWQQLRSVRKNSRTAHYPCCIAVINTVEHTLNSTRKELEFYAGMRPPYQQRFALLNESKSSLHTLLTGFHNR
jgi:hypothetical protein